MSARRVEATERHEGEPLMLLVDGVRVPRHTVVVYTCADCGIGEECYCEDPRFEDAPEQDGAP